MTNQKQSCRNCKWRGVWPAGGPDFECLQEVCEQCREEWKEGGTTCEKWEQLHTCGGCIYYHEAWTERGGAVPNCENEKVHMPARFGRRSGEKACRYFEAHKKED